MRVACLSDMGKARELNEDYCAWCQFDNGWNLLIVADGMGGHNAGEVASRIAVESIRNYINENIHNVFNENEIVELIKRSILKANRDIYSQSCSDSKYSGMGTTVTAAMIFQDNMLIGHVGDSRAYILKSSKLQKITNDHSLVAELVKNGTITEDEAQRHPQKHIITRALGIDNDVEIDIESIHLENDNIIILCTDGLTNMVQDGEMEYVLINTLDPDDAATKLVDLANDRGGYDNITIIIAKDICLNSEVK